jgi:hypothetical protein
VICGNRYREDVGTSLLSLRGATMNRSVERTMDMNMKLLIGLLALGVTMLVVGLVIVVVGLPS